MRFLAVATVLIWLLTLWRFRSVFRVRGVVHRLQQLVVAAALATLSVLLAMLLILLRAVDEFSGETLVARVTTHRLSPDVFELVYTPAHAREAAVRHIPLHGDQWAISGGMVKWHPWLTALGVPTYHKPTRLSGQFSNLEQQRSQPPTVYPLEPATDWIWEGLYRLDPYLPFIEAVYGSSAYVYVEPKTVQEVYVTPSGYLIKRKVGR